MLQKWFRNEINHCTPLDPKWYFGVFRSFSKNFSTSNEAKLVFRAWMHYFRVPKLRKWFRNKINHSTPHDPKWCLREFQSISQTFGTSNDAKDVCRTRMHYFGVPELRKWFRTEINQSTPLDLKRCSRVFRSILQTSAHQSRQKLCSEPEWSVSGYRSYKNSFTTKLTILPH